MKKYEEKSAETKKNPENCRKLKKIKRSEFPLKKTVEDLVVCDTLKMTPFDKPFHQKTSSVGPCPHGPIFKRTTNRRKMKQNEAI